MNIPSELILQNDVVTLRPVHERDDAAIARAALDPELWKYSVSALSSEDDIRAYIAAAGADRRAGTRHAFSIDDRDGNVVGGTAYGNISANDRRLEVGWTWVARAYHGTAINKNAKFLLMRFAFDYLHMMRVEFKTDVLNQRARRALASIGAVEEGVLRSHTLMHDGRRRDTIYYSVLSHEWQTNRAVLFKEFSELRVGGGVVA